MSDSWGDIKVVAPVLNRVPIFCEYQNFLADLQVKAPLRKACGFNTGVEMAWTLAIDKGARGNVVGRCCGCFALGHLKCVFEENS